MLYVPLSYIHTETLLSNSADTHIVQQYTQFVDLSGVLSLRGDGLLLRTPGVLMKKLYDISEPNNPETLD
jgi:hypothetical protein